jgi:hypothetical protein
MYPRIYQPPGSCTDVPEDLPTTRICWHASGCSGSTILACSPGSGWTGSWSPRRAPDCTAQSCTVFWHARVWARARSRGSARLSVSSVNSTRRTRTLAKLSPRMLPLDHRQSRGSCAVDTTAIHNNCRTPTWCAHTGTHAKTHPAHTQKKNAPAPPCSLRTLGAVSGRSVGGPERPDAHEHPAGRRWRSRPTLAWCAPRSTCPTTVPV